MPIPVTLTNGKKIWLPDSWSDDQIHAYVANMSTREEETDLGSAFMRGLGQHAPDLIDLGAGLTGMAADITGSETLTETEHSIRDFSDSIRNAVGGEAMQDYSDTFGEKVAEGFGAIPGIVGSFAPTALIPGSGIPGAVAKFAAHGAAMAGGEGPGTPLGGAVQGGVAGAVFGGVGRLAGGLAKPLTRRLAHAGGVTGAVTGLGKLAGEDTEDALAMGLAMGAVAGAGKTPHHLEVAKVKEVNEIHKRIKSERPDLSAEEVRYEAAMEWSQMQKAQIKSDVDAQQQVIDEVSPRVEPIDTPNNVYDEMGLSAQNHVDPYLQGKMVNKFQKSYVERIRNLGMREAFRGMSKGDAEFITSHDPYKTAQAIADVRDMSPEVRQNNLKRYGLEGSLQKDHELIKVNILGKIMIGEFAQKWRQQKIMIEDMQKSGAAKQDIKMREAELDNLYDNFVITSADYTGLGREMSHAMNVRKLVSKDMPIGERALMQMMKPGNRPVPRKVIERILENPDDFNAAQEAIRASVDVKMQDYVYEAWINGLLSGPPTHAVNVGSNFVTQALGTVERGVAGMIDFGMHPGASKASRSRFAGEMFADFTGWIQGARAGWKEALKVASDDTYGYEVSKTDKPMFLIPGKAGKAIRTPSTVLRMADMFFKNVGAERELHATAYRHAMRKGLTGNSKANYIKNFIARPDAVALERMNASGIMEKRLMGAAMTSEGRAHKDMRGTWMEEAGQVSTFTNKLGEKGRLVAKGRDLIPGMGVVIPFVRTPLNIMKYGLKRTPLNIIRSVSIYNKYRKGEMEHGAVVDEAAGTLLGTAMAATIFAAAKGGMVTGGGPSDWSEEMNLRETGWRPYSIKLPGSNTWRSYSRIEPLATIFGMAADAAETGTSDPDFADKMVAAVKENLTNKTFMVGVENLSKAWADPDMFAEAYGKIMLGSLVPAAVGNVTNITDEYARTADLFETVHGIPEPIARRLPGFSEQLPIRYTPTGEPVKRRERAGAVLGLPEALVRGMSPIEKGVENPNAVVEAEMARLSQFQGLPPSMPSTSTTIKLDDGPYGEKIKLTDGEYFLYHKYHRLAREQMQSAILSDGWGSMQPEYQAYALADIYRQFQRAASQEIKQSVYQRLLGSVDTQ